MTARCWPAVNLRIGFWAHMNLRIGFSLALLAARPGASALCMAASSSSRAPLNIFITGCTDGIGRHTCQKLAADGHHLWVHGRASNDGKGDALVDDLVDAIAESRSIANARRWWVQQSSPLTRSDTEIIAQVAQKAIMTFTGRHAGGQGSSITLTPGHCQPELCCDRV